MCEKKVHVCKYLRLRSVLYLYTLFGGQSKRKTHKQVWISFSSGILDKYPKWIWNCTKTTINNDEHDSHLTPSICTLFRAICVSVAHFVYRSIDTVFVHGRANAISNHMEISNGSGLVWKFRCEIACRWVPFFFRIEISTSQIAICVFIFVVVVEFKCFAHNLI